MAESFGPTICDSLPIDAPQRHPGCATGSDSDIDDDALRAQLAASMGEDLVMRHARHVPEGPSRAPAIQLLEEGRPSAAEDMVYAAYMARGFELEGDMLDAKAHYEATLAAAGGHDGGTTSRAPAPGGAGGEYDFPDDKP